jgi:hypothetical protein
MKKQPLYVALLCLISVVVHAQQKTIVGPMPQDTSHAKRVLPADKNGCPAKCPASMSCDGGCCLYATAETIGQQNYYIHNACDAIKDLHFRFEVTKEFTAEYDNEVSNCNASQVVKKLDNTEGIVVQFNCFSKDAPNALVQYIFWVNGTDITPHIQYAGGTPDKTDHDWQRSYTNAYGLRLAKANSLAKGFVLEVELNSDDRGYVNGATFTVTEPDGKKHVQKVSKEELFPIRISEFETNIVSTNGRYVHFAKGGEGTLSYSSKEVLCVEGGNYEHCAVAFGDQAFNTCETSNARYGRLSDCCTKAGGAFEQAVVVK